MRKFITVMYRKHIYAGEIEDGKVIIIGSKGKAIDITDKKYIIIPEDQSIVEFALNYYKLNSGNN